MPKDIHWSLYLFLLMI